MEQLIDGKRIAREIRAGIAKRAAEVRKRLGRPPGLGVLLVGDDPASQTYVRMKEKACEKAGIHSVEHRLARDTSQAALLERVVSFNEDRQIDGILVQLPLPPQIDTQAVLDAIDPDKDVDGFHAENLGRLVLGSPRFVPCTPKGVMHLIERVRPSIAGLHAVVVGRSNIVGKPLAFLLLAAHATVTICHSRTKDLAAVTRRADILVAAVGREGLITREMVKPGAIVIDVGINRRPDGTLTGDVDFEGVQGVAGAITPVPGGVGPMTIAMLLENTVISAERKIP
ncbi:MAG: bifunctional methylenetetrahydrofolate dehydrogenase/methenyltetrahydrofolate cyclohydrolase FolD [Deltaproteobacteria bacterium]|nr:MAG: bifunctional methylenetetrahydrofolate dehydrogenase/methenyltetrahydrofolate cyclohydrolase FolD [Deltaproteobacteria bacterium]